MLWDFFNRAGIVGPPTRMISYTHPKTGNTHTAWYFSTFTLPLFTELHRQWYQKENGKNIKLLRLLILSLLELVAYWLSGEWHYNKRDGCIETATHSFTPSEVDTLRAALLKNLNIESTRCLYNKNKEQSIIRIPKREVIKVQHIVKPHIPTIMCYRVGLPSSSSENSIPILKNSPPSMDTMIRLKGKSKFILNPLLLQRLTSYGLYS